MHKEGQGASPPRRRSTASISMSPVGVPERRDGAAACHPVDCARSAGPVLQHVEFRAPHEGRYALVNLEFSFFNAAPITCSGGTPLRFFGPRPEELGVSPVDDVCLEPASSGGNREAPASGEARTGCRGGSIWGFLVFASQLVTVVSNSSAVMSLCAACRQFKNPLVPEAASAFHVSRKGRLEGFLRHPPGVL